MPNVGDLEATVMTVVWSAGGPLTVREVKELLTATTPKVPAYTTVLTVMTNLHRKGLLQREESARAYRYTAAQSREAFTAELMREALESGGDRSSALLHFADSLSDDERKALLAYARRLKRRPQ